ncbi:hypothetical protein SAMN05216563_110237 [Phytobacter palmae]|nr:hypothetical protein SAMN05216563_110237 [Phytobacter palmae]
MTQQDGIIIFHSGIYNVFLCLITQAKNHTNYRWESKGWAFFLCVMENKKTKCELSYCT